MSSEAALGEGFLVMRLDWSQAHRELGDRNWWSKRRPALGEVVANEPGFLLRVS